MEANGDFDLPVQGEFDLVDGSFLPGFLDGDINISTGEDLTGDSLLREVQNAYYGETTENDEKGLD